MLWTHHLSSRTQTNNPPLLTTNCICVLVFLSHRFLRLLHTDNEGGRCCRTVEKKGRIAKTKSSTHQLCRQFGQREGEAKRVTDVKGGTTQCYVRGTGPGMLVPPLSGKTLGYERIFHTNHLFRLHNDNELTENLITTNVRTPV